MATTHYPNFTYISSGVKCSINTDKLNANIDRAQFWLDSQVMNCMTPLMPMRTGIFINLTKMQSASLAGTGEVIAAAPPYGRFLYFGKVMIDPVTKSPWARAGVKKIVTSRPLTFANQQAVPMWFDASKQQHLNSWIQGVNNILGGTVIA